MGSIQPTSVFASAEYIPPDAIFEVTKGFLADSDPRKVNVGAGTYRDENGKPWVLPSVRMAKEIVANCGHEYLPIAGLKTFRDKAAELVFHDTKAWSEGRVATCQSLSGTGALHLAGLALKKANPTLKTALITEPTWSNHDLLFSSLGFEVIKLPYYKTGAFDFPSYMAALRAAPSGSVIVLHSCAHNPTGCDPSKEQWKEIATVIAEKSMFPVFDSAYLGFNSGNVDEDAWAIRYFIEELKMEASVCLSFAKSMGLYGERIGLVTFSTGSQDTARVMNSILENVQRATVSTPPVYGAQIAGAVLNTPEIAKQWAQDLITMSSRVQSTRRKLYEELLRLGTPGDWSHIVKQSGMFGYTGISPAQIKELQLKYHIYMADTSRISIAGLNESNVEYFAQAMDHVVRTIN
ncbi:probable aspartate aminotransferase, cytoplasmic [Phialocephala subalpina]|uniref:Aspartate aminotransferase n=1 Tax=Phialocephala subalpina TaxID=576137 RepID=A0A1L7XSV8_9HELO|nr:probable aspartate aminotransferase, cytoplasmic [Phialocephala subalpina]